MPTKPSRYQQAEAIVSVALHRTIVRFWNLHDFRVTAKAALDSVDPQLLEQAHGTAKALVEEPSFSKYFHDREAAVQAMGGPSEIARSIHRSRRLNFVTMVDAAAVMIMYSLLEAAVHDMLRACAEWEPDDFDRSVADRKVPLEQIAGKTYRDLLVVKVTHLLHEYAQRSIIEAIDLLMRTCLQAAAMPRFENYSYDRSRVERFVEVRHDIVHHQKQLVASSQVAEGLTYVLRTIFFLYMVTHARHGFRIDAGLMPHVVRALATNTVSMGDAP